MADFTPAPIRVRAWDSKAQRMVSHEELQAKTALATEVEGLFLPAHHGRFTLMLSTGLHDADGREVFEGDHLTWNEYHLGDGPDTTGVVVRSLTRMFLDVPELTMPFDIGSAIHNYGARVTGHIYAP